MCRECALSARELFPELSDQERADILWEFTSFPFGGPQEVREQLATLGTKTIDQRIAEQLKL